MRLLTKESRLAVIASRAERLKNQGFEKEEYKTLQIFTKKDGDKPSMIVYRGTSTNPISNYYYRSIERMEQAKDELKKSEDRRESWKEEAKKNKKVTGAAACAAAIRTELKEAFPGIKFSVKCENYSGGNSVNIFWTDGPTVAQVEKISGKYQYGHFNGMEDIYEYSNNIEGLPQVKYVFEERTISAEVMATLQPLANELFSGWDTPGRRDTLGTILHDTPIPLGARVTGLERTEATAGLAETLYRITFEEVNETPTFEKVDVPAGEVQIIEYSKKAIAVIGDTKPIKDKLKDLGGKFNFRLSCGPGWIFQKSKLSDLQKALS